MHGFYFYRRTVNLCPSLPPFVHSTCYFHPSHTMDKHPIQSLSSVQSFEHFLASFSRCLHRLLLSHLHSTVQNQSAQSIADINYVITVAQKKKTTSSHCPAVYKYLLNCKSGASLARQHYRSEFHRRHEAQRTWLLLPEHLRSSLSFTIMF